MAKTNAILTEDRSAAAPVALAVLCALALAQGVMLLQAVWSDLKPAGPAPEKVAAMPEVTSLPNVAVQPAPQSLTPSQMRPSMAAPSPVTLPPAPSPGSLPPLPSSSNGLPPLPKLPSSLPPPTTVIPVPSPARPTSMSLPQPSGRTLPSLSPSSVPEPSSPAAPIAKTGNAQVDELIEVAVQSRDLNDADGAMQALERADLILPDHPVILREKAITYGKLGRADKAQALWDKVAKLGPGAGASTARSVFGALPPPLPLAGNDVSSEGAPGRLNSAFGSSNANGSAGPLSLGPCEVVHDSTVTKGEKVLVKIPVRSTPGTAIAVTDWNLDVLFYDRVDEARLEPTNADPVVLTFDMPVDFQTSKEVVTAVYQMPELTSQEVANIGHRAFGGYVIKLYYKNRLMSTAASPRELLSGSSGQGSGSAPVANPLLPPLPK